ncbi:MAG: HisA/HisF-related TIM barrel protein [Candidatus Hydrothermarchaeota archaeon]|nr:HisA/HisF-related TIM barrel protein [Candidatus Hydrothermarchaeota archaeon]
MEIIPVLDIQRGQAVSGKSGERCKYTPLKTVYSNSSNPLAIAENLPWETLYVADLDGIMYDNPDFDLLEKLCMRKKTMVDAGLGSYAGVHRLATLDCELITGTETLEGLNVIKKAIGEYGNRVWVSLDIKNDKVLSKFLPSDALEAVKTLSATGVMKIIILNISAVGTLRGLDYALVKALTQNFPDVEFIIGGGIRKEDVKKLEKIGVEAVLVGTALHSGLLKT